MQTHGIDAAICRGSNNYGPRQYPEKLIPLMILNAVHGDSLPVYGDGRQVRNWLWVEDFARAIDTVLEQGEAGQAYNAGGPDELREHRRGQADPVRHRRRDESLIEHVTDRPGHDRRYSLASDKLKTLGWAPQVGFAEGLPRTVELVSRERGLVEADPLRRVPRVLRAPLRAPPQGLHVVEHVERDPPRPRSTVEKPASLQSSLDLRLGMPHVPSPSPPWASEVVMQYVTLKP